MATGKSEATAFGQGAQGREAELVKVISRGISELRGAQDPGAGIRGGNKDSGLGHGQEQKVSPAFPDGKGALKQHLMSALTCPKACPSLRGYKRGKTQELKKNFCWGFPATCVAGKGPRWACVQPY